MTERLALLEERELPAVEPEAGFGCLETAQGALPLKAMDVKVKVVALAYDATVRQTFANSLNQGLEATYVFPLPSRAAVSRFRLTVAGRVIEGVLKERGEARREYREAIEAGHRAALAEEDRPSVFMMTVGNIMPGEEAQVELTLNGHLIFSDGEAEFRFPFVVAPRYIPGAELGGEQAGSGVVTDTDCTPDASRISPPVLLPGFRNPVRLGFEVDLDPAGLPVSNLRSSLHAVRHQTGDDGRITVSLYPQERLNRDFILRFAVGAEKVTGSVTLCPDADGGGGTFMATLVPPAAEAAPACARDVIFVLDRSGSMEGWKIVAARRALGRMVDTLGERDRFTVFAFDTVIEYPPGHDGRSLQPATDRRRFSAFEYLGRVEARGGTEMAEPLSKAVTVLATSARERDRVLVLVTDGQIGNESEILRRLRDRLGNIRVFALGVDRAVNEGFLRRLSQPGGGACELIESEDRLDEIMTRTHRRIAAPALVNLRVELTDAALDAASISPARLPDVFAGAPAIFFGRYVGEPPATVTIHGEQPSGGVWQTVFTPALAASDALTKLWARSRIRDLEDEYAKGVSNLEKTILDVSLRFGVLSRFTAFVAVDRSEVANAGGRVQGVNQPVDWPDGWAAPSVPECRESFIGAALNRFGFADRSYCYRLPMAASADVPPTAGLERREFRSAKRYSGPTADGFVPGDVEKLRGGAMADAPDLDGKRVRGRKARTPGGHRPVTPPTSKADARRQAKALLKALREALQGGTDALSQRLLEQHEALRVLAEGLAALGEWAAEAVIIKDVAAALAGGQAPDSAEAARLWGTLEGALAVVAGETPPGGASGGGRGEGFWRRRPMG